MPGQIPASDGCAWSPPARPGTVLARWQFSRARSEEASAAYALADHDLLTIVAVDLDGLKGANDSAGHPAGVKERAARETHPAGWR